MFISKVLSFGLFGRQAVNVISNVQRDTFPGGRDMNGWNKDPYGLNICRVTVSPSFPYALLFIDSPMPQNETDLNRCSLEFAAIFGRMDEATVNVIGRNRHNDMELFDLVKPFLQIVVDRPISNVIFWPVF